MYFIDPNVLTGMRVVGRGDVPLGVVECVYADMRTGQPQWAAIRSGLFGTDVSLVPLTRATRDNRCLLIPYGAQEIRDAPHRVPGIAMSHKEEANLFRHYGVSYGSAGAPRKPAGPGRAVSGRTRGSSRTMLHKHAGFVSGSGVLARVATRDSRASEVR